MNLLRSYEDFFINNEETVNNVESLLQLGFSVAPTRFGGNNEIVTEAAYAGINLLSLFHDIIKMKKKSTSEGSETSTEILPSWWEKSAILLSGINAVFILLEIYSRSKKRKWETIFAIEFIRVFIRLNILVRSKGSILVKQIVPIREKSTGNNPFAPAENGENSQPRENKSNEKTIKRKTLMDTIKPRVNKNWENFWLSQSKSASNSNIYIPSQPTKIQTLGEILYIFRPIIYLIFLMKNGKQSWKPWIISFIVDYLSNTCSKNGSTNNTERNELFRRKMLWAFYLLRSPFYEKVLLIILSSLFPKFLKRRLAKFLGLADNAVEAYRKVYFYTSSS